MSLATAVSRSEWSVPPSLAPRHAIDHHVARYAAWLRRAGAEPRLALILCAGKGARRRLVDGLEAHGVDVVQATSTLARPFPPAVLNHQGDHFNDRLFLVDGFEGHDPEPQFEELNLKWGQLKKTATWVGVVVESIATLRVLYGEAQALLRAFDRKVLVLAAGAPTEDPAPNVLERLWGANGAVAEQTFATALTPRHPITYDAFSRLVRAGYVANFLGASMHPDREALVKLWADRAAEVEASPVLASALARHGSGSPIALEHDPLSAVVAGAEGALPAAWQALAAVEGMGAGAAEPDLAVIDTLLRHAEGEAPGFIVQAHLAVAAAHAVRGNLPACIDAVATAREHAGRPVPPEVEFRVHEKAIQLDTFRGARTAGQAGVDRLAALAEQLQSPFYDGRHLLARAQFTEPLDARRAAGDYEGAHTLFAGHGYPEWATDAAAGLERCR